MKIGSTRLTQPNPTQVISIVDKFFSLDPETRMRTDSAPSEFFFFYSFNKKSELQRIKKKSTVNLDVGGVF